jgi:hypothetical protein
VCREPFSYLPNKLRAIDWESLSYLPNKLRAIDLPLYPLKSLPMSFSPDKLVKLDMHFSLIEEIWNEKKVRSSVLLMQLSVFFFLLFSFIIIIIFFQIS